MGNALIGLKQLRENAGDYIAQIQKGKTFIVVRRSKPVFKISPPDEGPDFWEPVVDFTKIRKGGVSLKTLLSRITEANGKVFILAIERRKKILINRIRTAKS